MTPRAAAGLTALARPCRLALLVLLSAAAVAAQPPQAPDPGPDFRSRADVVRIEVDVRRGDAPVRGLRATDFEVRDNGVPQRLTAATPLSGVHVVVAIDVSGSVDGELLLQQKEAVLEVLARVTADDCVSVVAFNDRVDVLATCSDEAALLGRLVGPLRASGGTALHDALIVASALARPDPRPAVVLLFTDGGDSSSWASARRALDHLRRLDTVVFPLLPAEGALSSARRGSDSVLDPLTHPHWLAPGPADTRRLLDRVAEVTGGEVIGARAASRLLETFAEVLGRYRQRYVLSFEPSGVATRDGWHTLDVRVVGQRAKVTARDGYWAGGR